MMDALLVFGLVLGRPRAKSCGPGRSRESSADFRATPGQQAGPRALKAVQG